MAEREKEGEAEEKDTFGMKRNAKYRLELKSRENTAKSQKKFDKELEKAEQEAMVDKVAFGEGLNEQFFRILNIERKNFLVKSFDSKRFSNQYK